MRDPQELCQISILKTTREELRKLGGKSETYDAVIYRLILEHNSRKEGQ